MADSNPVAEYVPGYGFNYFLRFNPGSADRAADRNQSAYQFSGQHPRRFDPDGGVSGRNRKYRYHHCNFYSDYPLINGGVYGPFLSLHFLAESPAILTGAGAAGPDAAAALGLAPENILAYGIAVLLSTAISVRLGFPTPYLIGPLIGAAALVLWGWPAPTVPPFLITFAQVAVGAYMGLSMNLVSLQNWRKLLPYSLGFGLGIVFLALGIGYCLTLWHPLNLLTAFLATAPGGMTEMGVTAVAAGADLSVVAAYQLFRVLFILFVVPILLKWGLPKLTAARLNCPGP